jgi:hypothetical protein
MPKIKQVQKEQPTATKEIQELITALESIFPGEGQRIGIKAIATTLLWPGYNHASALVEGTTGSFKSSLIGFIANQFQIPTVTIATENPYKPFLENIANTINVPFDELSQNRLAGVNVQYVQNGKTVKTTVEINAIKYPTAEKLGKPERKPAQVAHILCTATMDETDLLGYPLIYPAEIGDQIPAHFVKGPLFRADIVILDELYKLGNAKSALYSVLNECYYTIPTLGKIQYAPLGTFFATNPQNDSYQTNLQQSDVAFPDRITVYAEQNPPSSPLALATAKTLDQIPNANIPIEKIFEWRKIIDKITINPKIISKIITMINTARYCYFSNTKGTRSNRPFEPTTVEKDCASCVYNNSICSYTNITPTRLILELAPTIKVMAALRGATEANSDDATTALLLLLPHRLQINNKEAFTQLGNSRLAMAEFMMEKIESTLRLNAEDINAINTAITARDFNILNDLRKKHIENTPMLGIIDDALNTLRGITHNNADTSLANAMNHYIND